MPKDNPELRDAVNKFLDREMKNGDVDKLKTEWLTMGNLLTQVLLRTRSRCSGAEFCRCRPDA